MLLGAPIEISSNPHFLGLGPEDQRRNGFQEEALPGVEPSEFRVEREDTGLGVQRFRV